MGWSFQSVMTDRKEFIKKLYDWETDEKKVEPIDIGREGNTYYVAIKVTNKLDNTERITANVVLTHERNDYYNFGYKAIGEDFGPVEAKCPMRILKKLTPTDKEWANNWRTKCWKYHGRKAALNKLPIGTRIICNGHPAQLRMVNTYGKGMKQLWLMTTTEGHLTGTYLPKSYIINNGWEVI